MNFIKKYLSVISETKIKFNDKRKRHQIGAKIFQL